MGVWGEADLSRLSPLCLQDSCVEDSGLYCGSVLHLDEDAVAARGGKAIGELDGV